MLSEPGILGRPSSDEAIDDTHQALYLTFLAQFLYSSLIAAISGRPCGMAVYQ